MRTDRTEQASVILGLARGIPSKTSGDAAIRQRWIPPGAPAGAPARWDSSCKIYDLPLGGLRVHRRVDRQRDQNRRFAPTATKPPMRPVDVDGRDRTPRPARDAAPPPDDRAARRLGDVITIFIPSILVESGVRKPADGQGASTGDLEGIRPDARRSSLSLCAVPTSDPRGSNARASVGSPPRRKSAAIVTTIPSARPNSRSRRFTRASKLTGVPRRYARNPQLGRALAAAQPPYRRDRRANR
jgi:hypothetical protein